MIAATALRPTSGTIGRSESTIIPFAMAVQDVLMIATAIMMIVPGGITGAGAFTIGHRGTNGEEFLTIAGAMKAVAEVMVKVLIGNWRSELKRRPNGLLLWFFSSGLLRGNGCSSGTVSRRGSWSS
jgi:hypothetical protein